VLVAPPVPLVVLCLATMGASGPNNLTEVPSTLSMNDDSSASDSMLLRDMLQKNLTNYEEIISLSTFFVDSFSFCLLQ
jgi:hypothetical protein